MELDKLIERIDHKVDLHIKNTNDHLSTLTEVVTKLAVIQERQQVQTASLIKLDQAIRDHENTSDGSLSRVHKRIDEVEDAQKVTNTTISLHDKDMAGKLGFVRGAFWALAIFFSAIYGIGAKYAYTTIDRLEKVEAKVSENETQNSFIINQINQLRKKE